MNSALPPKASTVHDGGESRFRFGISVQVTFDKKLHLKTDLHERALNRNHSIS